MNKHVTIVLLSHRSKDLVIKFIQNIYNEFKIIIIDNSNDLDLKEEIVKKYPNIIFEIIDNNGYGAAINHGSKLVKSRYFLISNPDIEGLDKKDIEQFINVAKNLNDNFSALGPRFNNMDKKSLIQSNNNLKIADMKFLSGSCMFFKKETFELLGGFDENFFLYFEESDFCLRAYKKYKNYQINNIQLTHNVGTSVTTNNKSERNELKKLYTWHFIWSKFYYYKKNYSYIYALIYFIPIIVRTTFKILLNKILRNKSKIEHYEVRLNGLRRSIRGLSSNKRIIK